MTATWAQLPFLTVDTETTGVNPCEDRIVEAAAVLVAPDGTVMDEWSSVVDAGVDIPEGAAAVHGITTERMTAEGIPTSAALLELGRAIWRHIDTYEGRAPVVLFNAVFDWSIILAEADRHGVDIPPFAPVVDPMLLDRYCDRYRKNRGGLTLVADHYGVELAAEDAHGARADALAAGRVLRAMTARFPKIAELTLAQLWLLQTRFAEQDRRRYIGWKRRQEPGFYSPAGWPLLLEEPRS